jgi:hypothetical protein
MDRQLRRLDGIDTDAENHMLIRRRPILCQGLQADLLSMMLTCFWMLSRVSPLSGWNLNPKPPVIAPCQFLTAVPFSKPSQIGDHGVSAPAHAMHGRRDVPHQARVRSATPASTLAAKAGFFSRAPAIRFRGPPAILDRRQAPDLRLLLLNPLPFQFLIEQSAQLERSVSLRQLLLDIPQLAIQRSPFPCQQLDLSGHATARRMHPSTSTDALGANAISSSRN